MRKDEYDKYLDPEEFKELYEEWAKEGKPQGNSPLYVRIWGLTTESVKACIGALQSRYHCQYQDYDEKVMDSTILIMNKLLTMDGTPKNIVNMCYLPVLGVCCGPKARSQEMQDNALSLDCLTSGGDSFQDFIYIDEYGELLEIKT